MRVLVLAAHMDDEVLSCGGAIIRHIQAGDEVMVVTAFGRTYDQGLTQDDAQEMDCFRDAKAVLGYTKHKCLNHTEGEPHQVGYYRLLRDLEPILGVYRPEVVYIPSRGDINQDHRHLHDVCCVLLRSVNRSGIRSVRIMRAMDGDLLEPSLYVPMTEDDVIQKLVALSCYEREGREGNHMRSPSTIRAYLSLMGSKVGADYAEPFDILFEVER